MSVSSQASVLSAVGIRMSVYIISYTPAIVINKDGFARLHNLIINIAVTLRHLNTVPFTVLVRSLRASASINWNIFYIAASVSL